MKTQNLLTVDDVRIATATVNIQVIRIGAKQMTLAVFRQLPRMDIFDAVGNLLAPPWGWVNYETTWNTTPFLFSFEGVLYRDDVEKLPPNLIVKAEHKTEIRRGEFSWDTKAVQVPTGKWVISTEENAEGYWSIFRLRFFTEKLAGAYLANRQQGAAILQNAPQLFIAV